VIPETEITYTKWIVGQFQLNRMREFLQTKIGLECVTTNNRAYIRQLEIQLRICETSIKELREMPRVGKKRWRDSFMIWVFKKVTGISQQEELGIVWNQRSVTSKY